MEPGCRSCDWQSSPCSSIARLLQIRKFVNFAKPGPVLEMPHSALAWLPTAMPWPACPHFLHCCCADLQRSLSACRYAVADSPEALYVAFVGTKQRRDYWTLAAIRQQAMWPEDSSEAVSHSQPLAFSSCCLPTSGSFGRLRGVHLAAVASSSLSDSSEAGDAASVNN